MSRALLVLANDAIRERAKHWIIKAPVGTRVEFKAPQRSLEQNAKMWAMLTEIAAQAVHMGRKYDANDWKLIFLNALGRPTRFAPALDGQGIVPLTPSSSDLSKEEMSNLLELIQAWAAENRVTLQDFAEESQR